MARCRPDRETRFETAGRWTDNSFTFIAFIPLALAPGGAMPAAPPGLPADWILLRASSMSAPSQMSLRRIPASLHLHVRIAYANAWEALIGTHTSESSQFVCEFASRAPVLRALDLYFDVVAVPEAMQEVIRTRCLTSLDLESLPALTPLPVLRGWQLLRVDLFLEQQQYRRRYQEKTLQLARMVGARAAEAVIATHVENAIGFCALLRGVLPVEQATDHYLREFSLSSSAAQMVWQRVQARVAGEELTAQYSDPPPPILEPEAPEPEVEPEPEPATFSSGYPDAAEEVDEDALRTRSPYPD